MDNKPAFKTRFFRTFRNTLLLLFFLGAGGTVVYALSLLNAQTYSLEVRGDKLVVLKGRMMPIGTSLWKPNNSMLVSTYAPIQLKGNTEISGLNKKYQERDELDRALFAVLERLAAPRIASHKAEHLREAVAYVQRAERLTGLSEAQFKSLKKMQADLAFYLARVRLRDARRELEGALSQLKLAAEVDSRHKDDAVLMLLAVEPQVKLLTSTLLATTRQDMKSLSKAIEPTLQSMFEALETNKSKEGAEGEEEAEAEAE